MPFKFRSDQIAYKRKYYSANKLQYRIRLKKSQQNKKEFVNRAKMRPCTDCKIQYNSWVMQFDHREPKKKLFSIAEQKHSFSFKQLCDEIAKCDVVCANCHAERTHRRWIKE